MKNRKKRVQVIMDLISSRSIGSQEELVRLLADRGFKVTQATLSRDLKMLRTTKVATDRGTYMYILPDRNVVKDRMLATGEINPENHYTNGFVSLAFSGNIAVIKTRNGYAGGMAYDIDVCNTPEILGTIPGSDTVFAVLAEGVSHEQARQALSKVLSINKKH